jgi:hypothetical protein
VTGRGVLALSISSLTLIAAAGPRESMLDVSGRRLREIVRSPENAAYFPGSASEVVRELDGLVEALRRWYRALPAARRLAKDFAFPETTPWTPPQSRCRGRASAYAPGDAAWEHPAWKPLGYRPHEPHHFQYRLVSIGHGREASFSLHALGDLDCHGKTALYRLSGHARGSDIYTTLLRMRLE